MIIYIHGFGSSGKGGKSSEFRKYFKEKNIRFIAPSLSYIPELAIDTLEQLINSYDEPITLIGSSLGGFFSIYLAEKYGLKAVLINPAVDSSKTLKRVINKLGVAKNYFDNSTFTWNESHVDMLQNYRTTTIKNGEYLLFLQTGDEVLDYKEALEKLPNAIAVVEEGGTHPYEGISRHYEQILRFVS